MASAFKKRLRKAAFTKPDISIKTILPRAVSTRGSTINMKLKVFNPNPYALDVIRLAYRVCKVPSESKIAEGTLTEAFRIPAKESVLANMDVTFTFSGIGSAGRSFACGGALSYRVSGTLTVEKFLTQIAIPFEKEKDFSLFDRSESKGVGSTKGRDVSKELRRTKQDNLPSQEPTKSREEDVKVSRQLQARCSSLKQVLKEGSNKVGGELHGWKQMRGSLSQDDLSHQNSKDSNDKSTGGRWRPRKIT
mmetsp:Transcript_45560/g.138461  ORF Transcript_45560/g.138461 Transcript_45560/m.138461 type:complete len:249 (-) Transcript_45560:38-784(-)